MQDRSSTSWLVAPWLVLLVAFVSPARAQQFTGTIHGGKLNAQFRAEFFNAFNRVQFSAPATRVDSDNFGVVSGQANGPRQVQLSLKLTF